MYIAKKQPAERDGKWLLQAWIDKDVVKDFYILCTKAEVSRQDMLEWAIKLVLKEYEATELGASIVNKQ